MGLPTSSLSVVRGGMGAPMRTSLLFVSVQRLACCELLSAHSDHEKEKKWGGGGGRGGAHHVCRNPRESPVRRYWPSA